MSAVATGAVLALASVAVSPGVLADMRPDVDWQPAMQHESRGERGPSDDRYGFDLVPTAAGLTYGAPQFVSDRFQFDLHFSEASNGWWLPHVWLALLLPGGDLSAAVAASDHITFDVTTRHREASVTADPDDASRRAPATPASVAEPPIPDTGAATNVGHQATERCQADSSAACGRRMAALQTPEVVVHYRAPQAFLRIAPPPEAEAAPPLETAEALAFAPGPARFDSAATARFQVPLPASQLPHDTSAPPAESPTPVPAATRPAGVVDASGAQATLAPGSSWSATAVAVAAGSLVLVGPALIWLYNRMTSKADVLRGKSRSRVFAAIQDAPGAIATDIEASTTLHRTTVAYHARRLEEAGLVTVVREGGVNRYFPAGGPVEHDVRVAVGLLRYEALGTLVRWLSERVAVDQAALAESLSMTRRAVGYHAKRLEDAGLVIAYRAGNGAKVLAVTALGRRALASAEQAAPAAAALQRESQSA